MPLRNNINQTNCIKNGSSSFSNFFNWQKSNSKQHNDFFLLSWACSWKCCQEFAYYYWPDDHVSIFLNNGYAIKILSSHTLRKPTCIDLKGKLLMKFFKDTIYHSKSKKCILFYAIFFISLSYLKTVLSDLCCCSRCSAVTDKVIPRQKFFPHSNRT